MRPDNINRGEKLIYGFIGIMQKKGAVAHAELCNEMECQWYEAQEVIRELRNRDLVVITLDRRYKLTKKGKDI